MATFFEEWLLHPTALRIYTIIIAFVIIRLVVRLINQSWKRGIKDKNLQYQLRKVTDYLSYFVLLLVTGFVFSDQLAGLSVALGVATAGIAFALQEVITSFAGWLAILAGNFYDTGDRVQLGGITGDVIDISVLRTTIMETGGWVKGDLYNGRTVRVANSFVFKEPVYNYSAGFPFLWDEIIVPVKYGSDRELASETMLKVVQETCGGYAAGAQKTWADIQSRYFVEDAEVVPTVSLIFNDNWIEYTIRYVVDFKRRRATKDELSRKLLAAIDASEGKIAIASATFHIVETPKMEVKITQ